MIKINNDSCKKKHKIKILFLNYIIYQKETNNMSTLGTYSFVSNVARIPSGTDITPEIKCS